MATDHRAALAKIKRFDQLIAYLRDEMGWPIANGQAFEDLTFEYTAEELGIDAKNAAKIQEIKRLRPLSPKQPWGIFFVKFEPKKLPVVALRRILSQVALKKRASANSAERAAWAADDLLFVSNYGEGDERQISFAHFSRAQDGHDLPTLKVLGWDNLDTALHLDAVVRELTEHLAWPDDDANAEAWRTRWRAAFTLRHREVVTTSKELSIRLAELARTIRDRIKTALAIETDKGPLKRLMKAFQEALVHDLDDDGFADMYAQTIAYGLLSARIADPHKKTADDFAAHMRTNPFLRELMETFLKVGGRRGKAGGPGIDFDELGVSEVVELLDDANMEAVVRDFGDRNPQEDPVIHFYELFLKEYDAKKRMQRGVFYTPRPVVSYIVRSVDELLRKEFGLADGLADTTTWSEMSKRHKDLKIPEGVSPEQDFVQILDPATGTGTFIVEVIDLIHKTLVAKWKAQGHGEKKIDALWNEYVPKHLLKRLHGYELLMAPYAIAHLKIGLKLYETGYRFGSDERARVYLTNALEPASDSKQMEFKEWIAALAHEASAVNDIKRNKRFTIVIGNPPYSGESANKIESVERDVKETYQRIDGVQLKEKGKKNWLLDDYVKFLRLSHRTIASTGCGFIGHIINNAFQDNPTFRGLRRSLLRDFSVVQILDLHGSGTRADSNQDAEGDENVFDIQQGVCVLILSRPAERPDAVVVTRGDLWGRRATKYTILSKASSTSLIVEPIHPKADQWYFISLDLTHEGEWSSYSSLLDAMPVNGNGLISAKDHFAYAFTAAEFERDLSVFLEAKLSDEQVADQLGIRDNSMWSLHDGRLRLRRERSAANFCRVAYRPFDIRHSLFHRDVIFNLRLPVTQHIIDGKNLVLLTTRMTKGSEWRHCFVSRSISDCALLSNQTSTNSFAFPLRRKASGKGLFATPDGYDANLSPQFLARFYKALGSSHADNAKEPLLTPEDIFHYAYAVFHSPGYRSRYAEFLKIDFPRLPLT
ncbi:MAG: type ISP restriction/modification enzyme, partial [Gemmatimonadaceae bacterium]